MPGRGQPWKEGGHIDDTILGEDIKDGSISEADLDSALTSKVNAGGHGIEDEGSPLTDRPTLNFVGEGVTATDDGEKTVVTIPLGGGGSLSREDLADPFTDLWFYDEFFYPAPAAGLLNHFELDLAGGNVNAINGEVGGVVGYGTANSAGALARLNICGAGLQVIDSTKKLIMKVRGRLTSGPADRAWIFGFFTSNSNGPSGAFPFASKTTNGLGFFLNGTGNIETYTDDNITPVTQDTGVLQDAVMHTYELEFDPAGTPTITWKIDGAIVATQTANLPSFNGAWYSNVQTNTTTATLFIDSLFIFNER